jgi:alkylation response protein AidB-like acyl-CoA dehydrogenase
MISHEDETLRAILDTAQRFVDRELAENIDVRDAYPYSDFAGHALQGAADAGFMFLTASEDLGGVNLPCESWAMILEKVASTDAGLAASLLAHAMGVQALLSGDDDLKAAYITADKPLLLGYPLYLQADDPQGIPQAGRKGDHFVLSGSAARVANSPVADAVLVGAELENSEIAMFLLPLGREVRPEPVEMLGLRSCPVAPLDLKEVELPASHLLIQGKEAVALLHSRFYPAVSAILIATLQASLDYAITYGLERYQGGKMIHKHSQLRTMYAMMAVEHKTLRAAWLQTMESNDDPTACLAVKILAGDLAIRAATDGVQLIGGYGYTMDYPQERRMRDARQAAELLGSPARMKLSLIEGLIRQQS